MGKRRVKRWIINLGERFVLVIFGILLSLVIMEIALRAGALLVNLPQTLSNLKSGVSENEYRILCIGESTTAGGEASWPGQLEKILNNRSEGPKFRVINAGRVGTNTAFILADLEKNIKIYDPEMVISMMGINDVLISVKYEPTTWKRPTDLLENLRVYNLFMTIQRNLVEKQKEEEDANLTELDKETKIIDPRSLEYTWQGDMFLDKNMYDEAENLYWAAITVDPKNTVVYLPLSYIVERRMYQENMSDEERSKIVEELLPKQIDLVKRYVAANPENLRGHWWLGRIYSRYEMYNEALGQYLEMIRLLNTSQQDSKEVDLVRLYLELGQIYYHLGDTAKSEEMVSIAYEHITPDSMMTRIEPYLGDKFSAITTKRYFADGKYFLCINNGMSSPEIRRYHYNQVYDILHEKGIIYVAMQYPTRDIDEIRSMFKNKNEILFVSNKENFELALKNASFNDLFIDDFAGTFGHATYKGNRLIAENLAEEILKELNITKN
jgi:tetratricopeptide (TPR) repeat protein